MESIHPSENSRPPKFLGFFGGGQTGETCQGASDGYAQLIDTLANEIAVPCGKMAEQDTAGAKQVTLAPPWLSEAFQVEHSIHRPSRLLLKDIEIVFRPDLEAEYERKKAAAAAGAQITGI